MPVSRAIDELGRLHDELGRAVARGRRSVTALSSLPTRSPEREDLVDLLDATAHVATALACVLDALDAALGNEGAPPASSRAEPDEVRAFLLAREPPPAQASSFHPAVARRASPMGELPDLYGGVLAPDNELTRRRIPKSFTWRETVELWVELTYLGGTHASGGLPARLDRAFDLPGTRTAPRARQPYPWDRDDVHGLRAIAARAQWLRAAAPEALESEHRRAWCTRMDSVLRAADPKMLGPCAALLAGWVDESPAAHPDVFARLREVADNDALPEPLRRNAHARIPMPFPAP